MIAWMRDEASGVVGVERHTIGPAAGGVVLLGDTA